MKQKLRQIYADLSSGRLSQREALERIKSIKQQEQGERTGTLLITPVWQNRAVEVSAASPIESAERYVVLCELPAIDIERLETLLPYSHCVTLQTVPQDNVAQLYSRSAAACFDRIQSIFGEKSRGKLLVQIVVAGDQQHMLLAGLSGLLKTAARENPEFAGQVIFVPAGIVADELAPHLNEEKRGGLDSLIKYEAGARQVLCWREVPADTSDARIEFKDHGVYLITGGLGSLGRIFAQEILAQTQGALVVVTGRGALTTEKRALVDGLSADGGRLSYRQLDVADRDQVERLIAAIQDDHGPLIGILHCAGMISDNFILKKSSFEFSEVLEPKVTGTFNLDRATENTDLDLFVLFSSIAATMGNVGQADYAAANSFMDQFAAYRNRLVTEGRRRGRTRSINWPLWHAGGMALDPASQERLQKITGIQPMPTATGIDAFHRSLAWPYDQILVAEGDLAQMRRALLAAPSISLEVPSLATPVEESTSSKTSDTVVAGESLAERTEDYLRKECSEVLKLPPQRIDPQAALEKYGIDSILAMKLTSQLEKTFGALPKTLFFEYQTIRELTGYFVQSHPARLATVFAAMDNGNGGTQQVDAMVETSLSAPVRRISHRRLSRSRDAAPNHPIESDPIAVIGLSGRYPEAINIDAYWENLRQGKDCIVEVPRERWDWREYFSEDRTERGHHYSRWGGFIAGVDEFDPLFFNIAPKEAKQIDPQERLFLQHVWMAIEDAGYTRAGLQIPCAQDLAGQVGVYVGVMYSDYQLFGVEASARGNRLGIVGSVASIANRVSYFLNVHGPSMTLDTMCSSSLTAIHLACQDLKLGRTSLAIAGGVNVTIHPNKYLVLSDGQFISSDGHCQSFGEGGDGYIPGEGVGAVVLKRLSEAKTDGDHIYGIIRGSALNHGGKTNGSTVPNPQAQASAITRALAESRTDARHISYIEAHGTGTKLGDPIEIAALTKAFDRYTQDTGFCLIGSAKSNIGHCESAAGMAGLTKVLLQMQHQQIVPSLHSARLNPHIDFSKTPFVVNQTLRSWDQPAIDGRTLPRIAGISSFGAGGSNAHLIVEEYQAPVQDATAFERVAILLSARTAAQLQQKTRDLLVFVSARLNTINLAAMAYTLQVGREAMDERLGFVVSSAEQLAEKLRAYLAGEEAIEDAYQGQLRRNNQAMSVFDTDADLQQTIEKWIANRKLSKLVDLWVKGLELDWSKLYQDVTPPRISLPAYPFAKERYWIDTATAPSTGAMARVATAVLHPLLHSNTSDLSEQRYGSTFTGNEFFLAEHQIRTVADGAQKVLPASAYLEMARAAVEHALPQRPDSGVLELQNIIWTPPIAVTENQQIDIALFTNAGDEIDYEIYCREAEQEILHCQGRAVISRQAAPGPLDLEKLKRQMPLGTVDPSKVYAAFARMGFVYGPSFQAIKAIYQGSAQLLARLRLPKCVEGTSGDYALHPSMMAGSLQASLGLIDPMEQATQPLLPFALDSLRIVTPCVPEMFAWVRYASGREIDKAAALDIDLCDKRGIICAQMRGLSWQTASMDVVEPVIDVPVSPATSLPREKITPPTASPGEIFFITQQPVVPTYLAAKKPAPISLSAASAVLRPAAGSSEHARPAVTLSNPAPAAPALDTEVQAASAVRLYDRGNGVFAIAVSASAASQPAKGVIADFLQALDKVRQEASLKVLMISGMECCFGRGGRADYNEAVQQQLFQAIASFPNPVISILQNETIGACFLFSALCDFMVCNEDAHYGYTDIQSCLYPTPSEWALFSARFGNVLAQHLLYLSTTATGAELRKKGWTCPIVPATQLEAYAKHLASTLATKSGDALRLLKQHLTRQLSPLAKALVRVDVTNATENRFDIDGKAITSPAKHLRLDTPAEDILVITLCWAIEQGGIQELLEDLGRLFAEIHATVGYKAIVLASEYPEFLPATGHGLSENIVFEFQRLIVESPIPVIAALENAEGNAWLVGQFCDACIYNRTGVYSSAGIGKSAAIAQTAAAIFAYRFGTEASNEILLTGGEYSGDAVERRIASLIVASQDRVVAEAINVAESCARLPRATLTSWKQQTAAAIHNHIGCLPPESEQKDKIPELSIAAPAPIALRSTVVSATAYTGGIVVVKMEDREAKNMFSDAVVDGVEEVFAHIQQTPAYKVVVLTGYDQYFASGGTKDNLLAIQAGTAKFTDSKMFQLPLDCTLPVIAAMQGHGIGAGWCLGMFGDIVLMSEESRYVSPYMNYGFTPGAGATWILPDKVGQDIARESLLTAEASTGRELKHRGVRLPVLPRAEVMPAAMALARQIAQQDRNSLIAFKRQLTAYIYEPLGETYRLELAMHEETFVGRSDTLAQIQNNFYPASEVLPAEPAPPVEAPNSREDGDALPAVAVTLKRLLANELQMQENDIDDHTQFVDLGLDSISGVSWIRKINEKYRTSIEATKVYSYPTLVQLSRYVKAEAEANGTLSNAPASVDVTFVSPAGTSSQARIAIKPGATKKFTSRRSRRPSRFVASAPASSVWSPRSQAIAVIGMAGQFPQAKNLEEFWQNIAEGRNCISQVPRHRWDVNAYYQPGDAVAGKTNSQWAGTLDEYDLFDPLFFNISPTEAEYMDPQQRLFLQTCWHAIENAGYDARALSGSKCGVFVGCVPGDYHQVSRKHQLSAQGFTGGATSILAARLSYFLNLQGACVSIDTACSSSLVAIAQACDSLNSRDSDLALAGGVYVMAGPDMHIKTSQAGMLSPEGKCFTFDQRADGFVPGEAVGVVVLKRLADAERDQDIIYGVIDGWGVNQDGKTNGITAPNPDSQTRLEQDVYEKYNIDPGNIQLIEAHGTGTKLGDPIEVEGLKTSFKKYTQRREYCALGSVKSNIGHCLTAAGIAGVIKVLLALNHKQLPPTINFEQLNEHIELTGSPFYVNTRLQEWRLNGAARRQAAISSFGFSGTNAHLVVGEHVPPIESKRPTATVIQDTKAIVPLSARTVDQLQQKARGLLDFIRNETRPLNLEEIAYTLQVGRAAMDERLGFVVSSVQQLADKLQAYVDGNQAIEDFCQGQVRHNKEALSLFTNDADLKQTIEKWIVSRKLSKLLDLWVKGLELNWSKCYGEARPQRITLPAYPFAKERYWIDMPASETSAANAPTTAALHPLLHSNTSNLSEQRYTSTFTGDESFFAEPELKPAGRTPYRVFPPLAFLEMARAAIERALPYRSESDVLELVKTVWSEPLIMAGSKQVSIALSTDGNERIEYEIYSQDAAGEIVHCQGRAVLVHETVTPRLDIEQLRAQIDASHRGDRQLLIELPLPAAVARTSTEYVLHPVVTEGVLQAATRLIEGQSEAKQRRVPFTLETLRVISPCNAQMLAWIRRAPESQAAAAKVDIDLCDEHGNVCVHMRGLSIAGRELGTAAAQVLPTGTLLATPTWQTRAISPSAQSNRPDYTEHHVIACELWKVDAEELASLIPNSQCLSLNADRQDTIAQRYNRYALTSFERIQSILRRKPVGRVLVQIVVPGDQEQVLLAGLSGLLKTAGLENERVRGQVILSEPEITAEELAVLLREETGQEPDPLIKYQQGVRQVQRWEEAGEGQDTPPIAFRDRGVYLITGGLGELGLIFAKEILERTRQGRVVLTGRSAISVEKQARVDTLSANGGRLSYRQVELGDLEQVRQLITAIRDEYQQLDGIIHCAGMVADDFIVKKAGAEFSHVLAPKVAGTYNLDQATQDVELDFFILFSSIAGALGNPGQADYACANSFIDQFAANRNRQVAARQRHGRTRSINWPLWEAGGMRIDAAMREILQQTIGVQPLSTATGLQAFYRSLALPCDQILVVEGIRPRITTYLQKARIFEPPSTTPGTTAPHQYSNAEMKVVASLDQLQQQLKMLLAKVVGTDTSIVDLDQPFVELGLDSFLGAEFVLAINKKYGVELSHVKLFDYATVRELSIFLEQEIGKLSDYSRKPVVSAGPSPVTAVVSYPALKRKARGGRRTTNIRGHSDDKIAIVGMSGRYPEADNLSEYWNNLAAGRNSISEVPPSRWDVDRYYDSGRGKKDKTYSKWLGALDDIDCFDPLFFRISPQEAEQMDPQHRLFLQESYRAFEDAGYCISTLSNRKCGVYLGISTNEYMSLLLRNGVLSAPVTSNSYAIAAARIAYYLNLKGPAISVDTACSSSLVAIHLASQALLSGEIDMALAGGVTLWLTPESYLAMSQAGMFSPTGQCKTFDDGADGIVNGEGVGAIVLKRLRDAEEDGDVIYGVILGSGINQDGKTNGITAPSINSQIELERTVYARNEIDPETISYIEMHGTGTKLGDPIELEALATVFKERTSEKNFCGLGSVKSNIGHTTSAAGVAGLQKVLLSMRHRTLVPSLNVTKENSRFDFQNSPFYISRETRSWDVAPGTLRRAAVSSFGFSGTNAHLVIEEYSSPLERAMALPENTQLIIPLSARTAEQLRDRSRDLLQFIRTAQEPVDLNTVAYTLQVGREAMEERVGFLVTSVDQLTEKLSTYISGGKGIECVYQGRVEPGNEGMAIIGGDDDMQEAIDKWFARKKVSKLLDVWIRGLNLDWNKLYGGVKPRRINLPTYPFARERCWIDETDFDQRTVVRLTIDAGKKSIEDIIDQIDDDRIETGHAVQALRMLV